jgi:hypothetical protein
VDTNDVYDGDEWDDGVSHHPRPRPPRHRPRCDGIVLVARRGDDGASARAVGGDAAEAQMQAWTARFVGRIPPVLLPDTLSLDSLSPL